MSPSCHFGDEFFQSIKHNDHNKHDDQTQNNQQKTCGMKLKYRNAIKDALVKYTKRTTRERTDRAWFKLLFTTSGRETDWVGSLITGARPGIIQTFIINNK